MNSKPRNYVGRDDDGGWIIALVIAIMVIGTIIAIMVYGGAFIGLYHSIKNYSLSFKKNVIDENSAYQAA